MILKQSLLIIITILTISYCQQNVIRVVSDLHVGSLWLASNESQTKLNNFLDEVSNNSSQVTTLVLLGDIIELWLTPLNDLPLTFEEVANQTNLYGFNVTQFIEKIKNIANSGVKVICLVRGNHDLETYASDVTKVFGPNVTFYEDSFEMDGILFEHGHQYDLFNAPLPDDWGIKRPFGYYVSRVVATTDYTSNESLIGILKNLVNSGIVSELAINLLRFEEVMEFVLETILSQVYKEDYEKHENDIVRAGSPDRLGNDIVMRNVVKKYRVLAKNWIKATSTEIAEQMLYSSYTGDVSWFVARKTQDLVVMGHTHIEKLTTYKRKLRSMGSSNIIYANSGSWVDDANQTYLDITIGNNSRVNKVELWKYNINGSQLLNSISSEVLTRSVISVPSGWSCDHNAFNSSDGCDCGCGIWDPDCDIDPSDSNGNLHNCPDRPGYYCVKNSYGGVCSFNSSVPITWFCPAVLYNNLDGCDCNCGAYDPDCDRINQKVFGCDSPPFLQRSSDIFCYSNQIGFGECGYSNFDIPSNWTCPTQFYNSGDGCDCNCGTYDPDCDDCQWNKPVFGCGNRLSYNNHSNYTCNSQGRCQII